MEASASQVVGSVPSSVERVQQHTVEQMVHVPTPQIQEHIGESIQVEEHIVDIPVPTIVEGSFPSGRLCVARVQPSPAGTDRCRAREF